MGRRCVFKDLPGRVCMAEGFHPLLDNTSNNLSFAYSSYLHQAAQPHTFSDFIFTGILHLAAPNGAHLLLQFLFVSSCRLLQGS